MTRAEKVQEAQALRAEGLLIRQIAERMGVATSTVDGWLNDPDLSRQRARRERYRTLCVDCGTPTDGSGGFRVTWQRCHDCDGRYQYEHRYWTPERVIAALQDWAEVLGRSPSATMALRAGVPVACSIVQREFGSWAAGLRAADLAPNRIGRPPKALAA